MALRFCGTREDHKLYAAMQIDCPCFRDRGVPFTQSEIKTLRKALLGTSRDQAGAFLIQVAVSDGNHHKQLMVELGKDRELFEHIMGALND